MKSKNSPDDIPKHTRGQDQNAQSSKLGAPSSFPPLGQWGWGSWLTFVPALPAGPHGGISWEHAEGADP